MDHNGNWDNSKLQQFFLPIDICEIQKIRPSHCLGEDFIVIRLQRIYNFD